MGFAGVFRPSDQGWACLTLCSLGLKSRISFTTFLVQSGKQLSTFKPQVEDGPIFALHIRILFQTGECRTVFKIFGMRLRLLLVSKESLPLVFGCGDLLSWHASGSKFRKLRSKSDFKDIFSSGLAFRIRLL